MFLINLIADKIHKTYLVPYISVLALALFLQQFLPDYFRFSKLEAISFRSNDGWCESKLEGFGIHCFGDFYYPRTFMKLVNPWEGSMNPWPPFSFYIYKPLDFLSVTVNPRFGIIFFLCFAIIAILFPLFHLKFIAKEISGLGFSILLIITLTFSPIIVSLDRGSNIIFCIPFLYLFYLSLSKVKNNAALMYLSILILLKPQFLILTLLFYYSKGLRFFLIRALFLSVLFISSFALYYKSFPNNVINWLSHIMVYQNYGGKGMLVPPNFSMTSNFNVFANIFNFNIPNSISRILVYFLAILSLLHCFKVNKRRTIWHNFIALLFFPILFTGTAFHYYLSILYVPTLIYMALVFRTQASMFLTQVYSFEFKFPILTKNFQSRILLLFSICAFIPWGIPWTLITADFRNRGWDTVGINWLPAQYLLMILALSVIFHGVKFKRFALNTKQR